MRAGLRPRHITPLDAIVIGASSRAAMRRMGVKWINGNEEARMKVSLSSASATTLAMMTHRAEERGDDITFLEIQSEVERRSPTEQEIYRREWIRTTPIARQLRDALASR
jgi:hypothetical protein